MSKASSVSLFGPVLLACFIVCTAYVVKFDSTVAKYKIDDYEWYDSIDIIFKKIDRYVLSRLDEDVQCDAVAIRELCELLKMHLLSIPQYQSCSKLG